VTQKQNTLLNILNHESTQDEPGKVLLTDITYLKYNGRTTFLLYSIEDFATREILAFELSSTHKMSIVYQSLTKLRNKVAGIHREALVHSNQDFHYTHPEFQNRVRQMKMKQSISRTSNCCLDNTPVESFFEHLKDELDFKEAEKFEEFKTVIDQYMIYYNESKRQWNLKR